MFGTNIQAAVSSFFDFKSLKSAYTNFEDSVFTGLYLFELLLLLLFCLGLSYLIRSK